MPHSTCIDHSRQGIGRIGPFTVRELDVFAVKPGDVHHHKVKFATGYLG
ncbi:hypothetical protein [Fodinicola feengrottensis]|nr:hypothetical protein [Fodinicola feengrottensis]